jgi:hypothetical protein
MARDLVEQIIFGHCRAGHGGMSVNRNVDRCCSGAQTPPANDRQQTIDGSVDSLVRCKRQTLQGLAQCDSGDRGQQWRRHADRVRCNPIACRGGIPINRSTSFVLEAALLRRRILSANAPLSLMLR